MRLTPTSVRSGAIAVAAGALVAAALLTAPVTEAAPAPTAASVTGAVAVTAGGPHGGDAVYNGGYRCTLGFNVRDSNNVYYFLTSRTCAQGVGTTFYANSARTTVLGTTVAISPGNKDYALVKYANGYAPSGNVDLYNATYQDITSAANAFVGESAKRSGSTTGVRSGSVTAVNVTVNYAGGSSLVGMIKTNICSEGGDTGGPLFDGAKALGLTSDGSGNCTTGGTTFFQPVTEPLAVYGVSVY